MNQLNKQARFYQTALDYSLIEMFIKLLEINPKPERFNRSVYLTWLAIQLLENLGNKFPSQKEIDATEQILKRYSNRKFIKDTYKRACLNKSNSNRIS